MEFDYKTMLEEAMKKMPKKAKSDERFEIPKVLYEIQGNKTLVKNFADILKILRRDATHLSKFLFRELATPGTIQSNILILQRKVPSQMLQQKVEDYVKEFVFCKECGEPDTKIVKGDRIYFLRCEACGAKYPLRSL